jgi:uncharacterized protein (TIGR02646 family)
VRHIDLTRLEELLPNGWKTRAAAALAAVRAAPLEDRSEIIERHGQVWRDLNGALSSLSGGKCWYCEAREKRSDKAVDHFRPKRQPVENVEHPGYWWLAFEWTNYRYSCTFCNSRRTDRAAGSSGGKHNHFPLLDESTRSFDEDGDLNLESPTLLDPVHNGDTVLLYFREDGHADSRYTENMHPILYKRAMASIDLYHLDHTDLLEARLELAREIKELVELGNTCYEQAGAGNQAAARGCDFVVTKLRNMMGEGAEFSMAVRDLIRGFLQDDRHPWLDAV